MDENIATFQEIMRDSGNIQSTVGPMLSVAGVIEDGLATRYVGGIEKVKRRAESLKDSWHLTEADGENLFYQRDIVLPYFIKSLDSLSARVELAKEGELLDSKRAYELNLRAEGLTLEDVEDAVETYHEAVDKMLNLEAKLSGILGKHIIDTRGTWHYERKCGRVIDELDDLASQLFGRRIVTPAEVDVKEKASHQFLGRINIGYEGFMPSLVRLVAHEGSFGHNTHMEMTDTSRTPFRAMYSHTTEGLSIFGEKIALSLRYDQSNEENRVIADFLEAKRLANDALGAAYEKLAFYDRLSTEEIADKLASRTYSREAILQGMNGLEKSRDRSFSFRGTPYYVGHKLVGEVYDVALDAISQMTTDDGESDRELSMVVNLMYTGHRPVSTMKDEINFHLVHRERIRKQEGPLMVNVPQPYK